MSTTELFMLPEEVEDFISLTLEDDSLNTFSVDDGAEIGLCPYITFYIYHTEDQHLPLADKIIGIVASSTSTLSASSSTAMHKPRSTGAVTSDVQPLRWAVLCMARRSRR